MDNANPASETKNLWRNMTEERKKEIHIIK